MGIIGCQRRPHARGLYSYDQVGNGIEVRGAPKQINRDAVRLDPAAPPIEGFLDKIPKECVNGGVKAGHVAEQKSATMAPA